MLKKILVVLSVILLLSVLALPAFAYETPWDWYETRWRFDETLSGPSWGGTLFDVWAQQLTARFAVDDYSSVWSEPEWDGIRLSFYSSSQSQRITIYDEQGWLDTDFRVMFIETGPQQYVPQLVQWMADNAVCIRSGSTGFPLIRVNVSGVPDHGTYSFAFAGSNPSSAITLTVDSSGGTFTHGLRTRFVPSRNSTYFLGFDANGDGVADYVPGNSYQIGGGFTSATSVDLTAVYGGAPLSTSVTIYNNAGTHRRFSLAVSSPDNYTPGALSPLLKMHITEYGADFYLGDMLIDTFYAAGSAEEDPEEYSGLSGVRNSLIATYGVGAIVTLGGEPSSSDFSFYIVYDLSPSTPDADWTSWILTAVGGFFDFELWPGLSLGDLVLVVISIGVLFAFLKITI